MSSETVFVTVPKLHQRGVNAEASYKLIDTVSERVRLVCLYQVDLAADLDTIGDGYYPVNGKSFLDTPKNTAYVRLNYDHGPLWASVGCPYRSSFWADWMNTERAGGFATLNFNAGWRLPDLGTFLTKPEIKINIFNLTDKRALTFDSVTTLLATKGALDPHSGAALYAGGAYYNLLRAAFLHAHDQRLALLITARTLDCAMRR